MRNDHRLNPDAERVGDLRGVIVGPMWARGEQSRRAGRALVRGSSGAALLVIAVVLLFVGAAYLDESPDGHIMSEVR